METKQLEPGRYSDAVYVRVCIGEIPKSSAHYTNSVEAIMRKPSIKVEVDDDDRKDIFQSSLLALWENIKCRRIYAEDGELKGKEGQPFIGTLTTYLILWVSSITNILSGYAKIPKLDQLSLVKRKILMEKTVKRNSQ